MVEFSNKQFLFDIKTVPKPITMAALVSVISLKYYFYKFVFNVINKTTVYHSWR